MAQDEFLEKVGRELSAKELDALKLYEVSGPRGRLVFMPILRKWGAEVYYQARAHLTGAAGPLRVSKQAVEAIGFPEDYALKSKVFVEKLNEAYGAIPTLKFPELPKGAEEATSAESKQLEEGPSEKPRAEESTIAESET